MSDENPTVERVHIIFENLKKYSSHPIIQKVLRESFDNENKSSDIVQPSSMPDLKPTTQPLRQEDEIV